MDEILNVSVPEDHRQGVPANYFKGGRHTWHQRRRHRCILNLLNSVRGEVLEVLDYGCGYGDLSYAIARTHRVQGVDVDPSRVAFAAREYAPIPFQVCRPDGLDFPDQSFDAVVSSVVLPFVPDPADYLRECHRVLRDRGHLILATKNIEYIRTMLRRLLGRHALRYRLGIWPRSEIRDLLQRTRFRVEAETYFYNPPFNGWNSFQATCIGLIAQGLSLFHVAGSSDYFVFLAEKSSNDGDAHG